MTKTLHGTIVTWFEKRGFGFIRRDDNTDEIFLHLSDVPDRKPLPKNTRVSFELGSLGGRIKAVNVRVRP